MEPWKLNSLAAEPSHSARIVALLMYCYIVVKELITNTKYSFRENIKEDKWVWIAFLWTMLTMGSGTAFLFFAIVLLKFVRFKSIVPLFFIIVITFSFISYLNIDAYERVFKVFFATLTLDVDTILAADHSASLRIIPMIIIGQEIDLSTLNSWFGYGIDYTTTFLSGKIPGVGEGFTGGGLFLFWMDYGLISLFFFLIFSLLYSIKRGDYLNIVWWLLIIPQNGINSQIVWLTLILFYTNIYFRKLLKRK